MTGTDVELAKFIVKLIGLGEMQLVETEFANLLPGVASGQWRMTTGLFATEKRRKLALFSDPIWALPDGLLVAKGNPLELSGYGSISAKSNSTLAVVRDQVQGQTALSLGIPDNRIRVFETYKRAARAVESGSVDAYASVARAHSGYLDVNPTVSCEVVIIPTTEKPPAFGCYAFSHSDDELCNRVNEVLRSYLGSASHREMMRSFGFTDSEIDCLPNREAKPTDR